MTKSQCKATLNTTTSALCLCAVLMVIACSTPLPTPEPPDTRSADEAAIRKTDADWSQAAQSKQVDAWVAFYTDDAVVLPPNEKTATTKEGIGKVVGEMLSLPGLAMHWQLTKVEVARSGDIAYGHGTYELTFNGPKGKPVTDAGKILEIWKKQPNGGWKCAVDTWSSDLPPAPPSK